MHSNNGNKNSVLHSKLQNKLTEDSFSKEILKPLKLTMLTQLKHTKWESLNLLSILKNNSNTDSFLKWLSQLTFKCQKILKPTQLLQLTGHLKEKSQELKIKVNVDHAGHSQPLVSLNHGNFSAAALHWIFQNNNSLIVQVHMEITDAMVDGHQVLLTMLKPMDLLLNQHIHMPLEIKIVLRMEETSESVKFYQSLDAVDYQTVSLPDHSQLLLMPPTGHTILQVSSITVVPALTMLSF